MERKFISSSSLARKFFDDFPDAESMPLNLSEAQQDAFQRHVQSLLSLDPSSCTLQQCLGAVEQLMNVFSAADGTDVYLATRSAADYVQSTPALCIIDAAGALSLGGQMHSFMPSLRALSPELYTMLLHEELRRRLVANGLSRVTPPVQVALHQYPPVASAILCADAADFMIVSEPPWEAYAHLAAACTTPRAAAPAAQAPPPAAPAATQSPAPWAPIAPFQQVVAAARQQQQLPPPGTLLRPAAWRRQLQRASSRYLLPLLGKDAGGVVVLAGPGLPAVIAGQPPSSAAATTNPAPASTPTTTATAAAAAASSSGPGGEHISPGGQEEVFMLSFVDHPDAAAAGRALQNCLVEVLTRHRARHPSSTESQQPLVVMAKHHVLLLLPEAAHTATGAFAAGHDAAICFDLTLHKDVESLLLGAPDPLAAWAYDGDTVWSTPRGMRAACSRALLLDPLTLTAAVAEGGLQLQPQVTGEPGQVSDLLPPPAAGSAARTASGVLLQPGLEPTAALESVKGLAGAGWQPLLLGPPADAVAAPAGGVVPADDLASSRTAGYQQLLRALAAEQQQQQGLKEQAAGEAEWSRLTSIRQLLQSPHLLRQLLESQSATAAGDGAAADGAGSGSRQLQRRLVQVLRLQYGWHWRHLQLQPSGAAAAEAAAVAQSVQGAWWQGQLMRGCVLREDAAAADG